MGDEKQELHTLFWSARQRGRLSMDNPLAPLLPSLACIQLKLGNYWLRGHIVNDLDATWFIAEGGTWREDAIRLTPGLTVRQIEGS